MAGNHISGTIPPDLLNVSSLIMLAVSDNTMHGTLPSDMGAGLPMLRYLFLNMNHFAGGVPSSLGNATMLYVLHLSVNSLTGTIPPGIGKLCPDTLTFDGNMLEASSAQDWESGSSSHPLEIAPAYVSSVSSTTCLVVSCQVPSPIFHPTFSCCTSQRMKFLVRYHSILAIWLAYKH